MENKHKKSIKFIIFLAFAISMSSLAFLMAACHQPTKEEIEMAKEKAAKEITDKFRKLQYDGHTYIFYQHERNYGHGVGYAGLTHDPDCEKCSARK